MWVIFSVSARRRWIPSSGCPNCRAGRASSSPPRRWKWPRAWRRRRRRRSRGWAGRRRWASAGDDAIGDRLVAQISGEGVDTTRVRRVAGARSGFSTIFMDFAGERMIVPKYDADLDGGAGGCGPILPGSTRGDDRCALAGAASWRWWRPRPRRYSGHHRCRCRPARGDRAAGRAREPRGRSRKAGRRWSTAGRHRCSRRSGYRPISPGFICVTAGEKGAWWGSGGTVRHTPAPVVSRPLIRWRPATCSTARLRAGSPRAGRWSG